MKRSEIGGILNFLGRVPVNRLEPKPLRNKLCVLHVALVKEQEKIQKESEALHTKFFKGKMERMGEFASLVDSLRVAQSVAEKDKINAKINRDYAEEKQLDRSYGEAQSALMEKDVAVNAAFDMDEFFASMTRVGVEVTGRDLAALIPIIKIKDTESEKK